MKTTLCIQVGAVSEYVENPVHIPPVGSTVITSLGRRTFEGVVTSVTFDYSEEGSLFITVKAR